MSYYLSICSFNCIGKFLYIIPTDLYSLIEMTTTWAARTPVITDWIGRRRPITYMAPLQDAYRKVHDQNNKLIYIISNEGKAVPMTDWIARPSI